MPMYHVNVSVVVGDQHLTFSKVVEAKGSVAGPIKLTVVKLQRSGEVFDSSDSKRYEGHASDLDLVYGEIPEPEPITDRRGAIRDQKARKANG